MRHITLAGKLCLLLGLTFLPACGGGGGGGGARLLAALQAALSGANETNVHDASARGRFVVEILSNGQIRFAATAEAAWVGDIDMMHIHRGQAGQDGGIEVDLLSGGATFDPITLTASGTLTIATALAQEIANSPGDFYCNIHTTTAAGGFVRAQLSPFTTIEWHAVLLGTEETTVADPDARGAVSFRVTDTDTIEYAIAMVSPSVTNLTLAHIHVGEPGVDGVPVVDLEISRGTRNAARNTITGRVTIGASALTRILNALGGHYCNVHTAAVPAGVARNQLTEGPVSVWSRLTGDQIAPVPVDPAATGGLSLDLNSATQGLAMLAVPPAQDILAVDDASVRPGAEGVNGTPVIDLLAGSDYNPSGGSFSAEGTVTYSQETFARLLANPEGFHVVFSTPTFPGGQVRGQLTQDALSYFSAMDGDNANPVIDGSASGVANVVFTSPRRCSFAVTMASPPVTDLTGAFIKDGLPGQNGLALIDLLGGSNVVISGNTVTGDVSFTGRTFARLAAASDHFYCDVHTAATPAPGPGICRGQTAFVSGDIPPASLSYQTPVVYQTGTAIPNNVPTSLGGAINEYSVSPALPGGISISSVTGIISGTPNEVRAATNYTVTAANDVGETTAVINITVNPGPPTNLKYTTPVVYVVGQQITPNNPTSGGGAITSYTAPGGLPAGLSLHSTTGVISGIPQAQSSAQDYVIRGSNVTDFTETTVNIRVDLSLQPPSNLSYPSPNSFPTGYAITPLTPTVSGGQVASYSGPAGGLPAGLTLDTTTGAISGMPTTVAGANNFRITATNASGSTFFDVSIAITLGAPKIDSYSNTPNIAYVGTAINTMVPTVSGGAISSWSISGTLPTGLTFDTSNGQISGNPSVESTTNTQYTVTASNSTNNSTYVVTIIVYAALP